MKQSLLNKALNIIKSVFSSKEAKKIKDEDDIKKSLIKIRKKEKKLLQKLNNKKVKNKKELKQELEIVKKMRKKAVNILKKID